MSRLKIGFMARGLNYSSSGVYTIISGLIQELSKNNCQDEFFLFTDTVQSISPTLLNNKFHHIPLLPRTNSFLGKFIWDHYSIGGACRKLKIDVLYSPAHVRPLYAPCPTVVQVLDMMYHRFPEFWNWKERFYFRFIVALSTPNASMISAISNNTKKDIMSLLDIEEKKIKVIYPGKPRGFKPISKEESVIIRKKINLMKSYILFVGSLHPRKNLVSLIDAFEEIGDRINQDLVIKVSRNWQDNKIKERITNSPYCDRIKLFEINLPLEDLVNLYNEADIFVYPSLYEGFGFPVLEALACGCPTVASNTSSIPEVTGDSALLVHPTNVNALSEAIYQVLTNNDLNQSLRSRALVQANKFSWSVAAEKTINLILETAGTRI